MTEYHIYKIKSSLTDKIYIGSTSKTLTERLRKHKYDYKTWLVDNLKYVTSFEILKFNDYVIELIETCVYIDKLERNDKEGYHIKLNKLICVNKRITGGTEKQRKKEWREKHPEYQKQYQKAYYQNNKEQIDARIKQYYKENKEQIAQYNNKYRDAHREEISERNKQYYQEKKEQINQ